MKKKEKPEWVKRMLRSAKEKRLAVNAEEVKEIEEAKQLASVDVDGEFVDERVQNLRPWQRIFLQQLASSPNISLACRTAKVSRVTAHSYKESDAAFGSLWEDVLAGAVDNLEAKTFKHAENGDAQLAMFLLKAHRPDKYRETTRQEVDMRLFGVLVVPAKEDLPP